MANPKQTTGPVATQPVAVNLSAEDQAKALEHPDVLAIKQFLEQTGEIPTQASIDDDERAAEYRRGWDAGAKATHEQDAVELNAANDEVERLRVILAATQQENGRLQTILESRGVATEATKGQGRAVEAAEPFQSLRSGTGGRPDASLATWWLGQAHAELGPLVAKAEEYGGGGRAQDLVDIGRTMASVAGRGQIDEQAASELGVFFYIVGKMGRWQAAVADGRPVSDDTLHDIGIYVRMAQRIRAVGGWPV